MEIEAHLDPDGELKECNAPFSLLQPHQCNTTFNLSPPTSKRQRTEEKKSQREKRAKREEEEPEESVDMIGKSHYIIYILSDIKSIIKTLKKRKN
jgi:transducin (beta)-like 1